MADVSEKHLTDAKEVYGEVQWHEPEKGKAVAAIAAALANAEREGMKRAAEIVNETIWNGKDSDLRSIRSRILSEAREGK